ncbi:MAG: hypothetical protein LC723_12220 [Actinobacteria bacterium]|nr:hypothetical protein [Actinomycetota bacterium]
MKFTLEITCDNAAFDENPFPEVARILREAARKVDDGLVKIGQEQPLRDVNGNRVGSFVMKGKL